MKKLLGLAVLLTATCVALASVAQAEVQQNIQVPTTLSVFVPCANGGAGEFIDVSGDLHVLLTFTINNNRVSGKAHFQPQGISGVGLTTGDKYQATGVTQTSFQLSLVNGQANQSFINNFRMIGQGPGNNFLVHENFHITFNANGDVTAQHDNATTDCK